MRAENFGNDRSFVIMETNNADHMPVDMPSQLMQSMITNNNNKHNHSQIRATDKTRQTEGVSQMMTMSQFQTKLLSKSNNEGGLLMIDTMNMKNSELLEKEPR